MNESTWEQRFRQKWEGANASFGGFSLGTRTIDELIQDISQELEKARAETRKELYGNHFMMPDEKASYMIDTIRQDERQRIEQALKQSWDKSVDEGTVWDLGSALESLKGKTQ